MSTRTRHPYPRHPRTHASSAASSTCFEAHRCLQGRCSPSVHATQTMVLHALQRSPSCLLGCSGQRNCGAGGSDEGAFGGAGALGSSTAPPEGMLADAELSGKATDALARNSLPVETGNRSSQAAAYAVSQDPSRHLSEILHSRPAVSTRGRQSHVETDSGKSLPSMTRDRRCQLVTDRRESGPGEKLVSRETL